jgi:UDPglucose 6-dehydrogenase
VAATGDAYGVDMSLIKEVARANEVQKELAFEKLKRLAGDDLKGKTITVLGLAFKAETDDVRDSPALTLVRECVRAGAAVRLHDPEAMDNFALEMERQEMPVEEKNQLFFANDSFEAIDAADALVILTEWNEYRNLDLSKAKSMMRGDVLYDARNVLDPEDAQSAGFRYMGTGRLV